MGSLVFLQSWYQAQCNGVWEHGHGITIESLSSPGWLLTVDLAETPLAERSMETVAREKNEKDWLLCEVSHSQFRGAGDSHKLPEILSIFETFAGLK